MEGREGTPKLNNIWFSLLNLVFVSQIHILPPLAHTNDQAQPRTRAFKTNHILILLMHISGKNMKCLYQHCSPEPKLSLIFTLLRMYKNLRITTIGSKQHFFFVLGHFLCLYNHCFPLSFPKHQN